MLNTLRSKLVGGLGLLIALQMGSAMVGFVSNRTTRGTVVEMMDSFVAENDSIARARIHLMEARRHEKNFELSKEPESAVEHAQMLDRLTDNLQRVVELQNDPENVRMAQAMLAERTQYEQAFRNLVEGLQARGVTEKLGLRGTLRAAVHEVEEMIKPLGKPQLEVKMLMCRRHEKDYLLRGKEKYLGRIDSRIAEFEELLGVEAIPDDLAAGLMASMGSYRKSMRELAAGDQLIKAQTAVMRDSASHIESELQSLSSLVEESIAAARQRLMGGLRLAQILSMVLLGVALVIGLLISRKLMRSILKPVTLLRESLEDLVAGSRNLSKRGAADLGEFVPVNDAIAGLLENLIVEVKQRSESVDHSARKLLQASGQISESASSQADSLGQVSSSLDRISNKANQTNGHAQTASQVSASGRSFAESGSAQILEMQAAMEDIQSASHQVSAVIKVIEDIAFQTNLLALNAAVEAARAGDAGKGFSVVAEEVRNLALRSAESVRDTVEMVAGVEEGVRKGRVIVDQVSTSFGGILRGAQEVDNLLQEIVNSANAQSDSVQEITTGVGDLDQVTQQNVLQAKAFAETARSSAQIAAELQGLTSAYTVGSQV